MMCKVAMQRGIRISSHRMKNVFESGSFEERSTVLVFFNLSYFMWPSCSRSFLVWLWVPLKGFLTKPSIFLPKCKSNVRTPPKFTTKVKRVKKIEDCFPHKTPISIEKNLSSSWESGPKSDRKFYWRFWCLDALVKGSTNKHFKV